MGRTVTWPDQVRASARHHVARGSLASPGTRSSGNVAAIRAGCCAVWLAFIVVACGGSTSPTPVPSPVASSSVTPGPATPSPSTAANTPSPSASPTPAPSTPTVAGFWDAVAGGIEAVGHVRIRVIGANPGVLRFEPLASETLVDDRVVFICVDGDAFDGQSGTFAAVPGTWLCGSDALVSGYRHNGQPLDSWSPSTPGDEGVTETVEAQSDGLWRWDYHAHSAVYGGDVTASLWIDPASGQIRDARRTDPLGDTRYGISYEETFPQIAAP